MSRVLIEDLARRINATSDTKGVVYIAGGGTEVFPILLAQGGGSATLLSARIPYDPNDFRAVLGYDPGRLVDRRAARGLAMAAFRHALTIRGELEPEQVFGLGATSKLSRGDEERVGRSHEIHAAIQTASWTMVQSVVLPEGTDRAWEERINALVLLNLLAAAKGVAASVPLEHQGRAVPPEAISDLGTGGAPAVVDLLVGRSRWVTCNLSNGLRIEPGGDLPRLLLPGSFRPLHRGHLAMAEAASRLIRLPCGFEISLFHPEKPPLDFLALQSRMRGFDEVGGCLYLTNAPTFIEKARLFPGCTFVVGHDTALRIIDPRFTNGDPIARDAMLAEMEALGTRLLIFGRINPSGQFREFDPELFEPSVARFLARNAMPVPGHLFRVDLSSTQIRDQDGAEFD